MQDPSSTYHQLTEIRHQIDSIIAHLTSVQLTFEEAFGWLVQLGSLIDSLPFPTDHYGVAKNRLRNAQRYYACGEVGAARYELRLLLGQMGRTFV